jgi:hypothetical protein
MVLLNSLFLDLGIKCFSLCSQFQMLLLIQVYHFLLLTVIDSSSEPPLCKIFVTAVFTVEGQWKWEMNFAISCIHYPELTKKTL